MQRRHCLINFDLSGMSSLCHWAGCSQRDLLGNACALAAGSTWR